MRTRFLQASLLGALLAPAAAAAQSLPFLFVDGPSFDPRPRTQFQYDAAYGDRGLQSIDGNGMWHRLVAAARLTPSLTALARVEMTPLANRQGFSEQVELNWQPSAALSRTTPFAVALGARREWQGTNVVTAHAAAAHNFGKSLLGAQVRAEHPLTSGRDAIDLITSAGWSTRVSSIGRLGVEAIGQDLEGFWSTEEAEGGATLFAGPSLALAPAGAHWALVLGGGPVLRATHSARNSGAPRDVVMDRSRGYLLQTSFRMLVGR
ncbi:MAG: hypothetical protein U0132_04235 [Gemmatimonadaceae bacterium]